MSIQLRSVLISDPVDASCAALFASHGLPVTTRHKMSKDELIREIQKHDALVVRSETKVTADVIEGAPNLRVIGRAGTGVDNIDLDAATRRGIVVLNTPGGNSKSACELTCALISALARNVPQAAQSMKEGRWDRKLYSGFELGGKTLGILGFGRVGREVAGIMRSYGMKIVAFDPLLTEDMAKELDVTKAGLEEIWPIADYITVHTPLIPQTKNLINASVLSKCKKGVCIVNVARGGIIDEEALLNSINSGHCGGAGLDVFIEEPPRNAVTLDLIKHPKVIATPHLGASTAEAQQRVAVEIAEQFLAISGKTIESVPMGFVNAPVMSAAMIGNNGVWIELGKKLGKLGARFLEKNASATIESRTIGAGNLNKKFIHTAVLVGILSGRTKNNSNLVNASTIAKDAGINVIESHDDAENEAVLVKVGQRSVTGTVRNSETYLLSIDDVAFDNAIPLREHVSLYRINGLQDLAKIVSAHSTGNIAINALHSNKNWLVIESNQDPSVSLNEFDGFS